MNFNCFKTFLLLFLPTFYTYGQSVYAPLNTDYYHLIERFEVKSGRFNDKLHSNIKPYSRKIIAESADSLWSGMDGLSAVDNFNLGYLKNDSWEWSSTVDGNSEKSVFKAFYKKKSDFYHFQNKDFEIHLNPVFYGFVGFEKDSSNLRYLNTRGLEVRGMIAKKLGFYSYFTDSQALFPSYVSQKITDLNAVPNEGYYKRELGKDNVDFLTARGYITFDAIKDIINVQFGYDKNYIGNGYRSLILSDYASNYLFLKFNTNVWKINYQNLYAQLNAEVLNADGFFPQKYFALHHLSINITKNLNIGFFESIVFNRGDSLGNSSGDFDFRYLNPVIFYRSIEQQAGSPDNANLGIDFKWNFLRHFSLYGQLLIDELVIGEIRRWDGWRGNKQAGQIGFKYIDVAGIANLDLQGELNIVRPYTYSHNFKYAEYSHYNQEMAHPLGANFYEYIGIIRFQPINRFQLTGKAIYAKYGADANGSNWGGNIFLNNSLFEQEYGNKIAQGIQSKLLFLDFTASWQVRQNMFLDFKQIYRKLNSDLDERDKTTVYTSISLRWNIPQRLYEF